MPSEADTAFPEIVALDAALATGASPIAAFREALRTGDARLVERFQTGANVALLVSARARRVDALLERAFRRCFPCDATHCALIAVGGYGRGELMPHSDVDLLLLVAPEARDALAPAIEGFLTFLWDIGLEIGHATRTLEECLAIAQDDITVATALMEARQLAGPETFLADLRAAFSPEHLWDSRSFFRAKLDEQRARHRKYHDSAYNLEPNIKEGPGGLRDIQNIGWVAKRHFGAENLHDLVAHDFLTETEYHALMQGQNYLWRLRFALHALTGRREDRLLFDHQRTLAAQFGDRDTGKDLAVEQFMQRYYRCVLELSRLNEMLLQHFEETILHQGEVIEPVALNKRFQARGGFIEAITPDIFRRYPFALLEIFLILQQHPELQGVRASTIRLIRDHRHLIDEKFRTDLRNRALFMEILRQPRGLTHELRRMNRYGVLAAYLPVFARVVGRMQYDLFHAYTVDEHTLFLVRNLRRFAVAEFAHEFPLCSEVMGRLHKPHLLYIAGLFHDIAKGRGGDHSELGAGDAEQFCMAHGLGRYDTGLVVWLVRHHLLMSTTAQRRDIGDPEVIHDFAQKVGDQTHLNYLYLLTVGDIRATNPTLWNSWKSALLAELYAQTKRALRRGLENPLDKEARITGIQQEALALLAISGLAADAAGRVWADFTEDYFLRYSAAEIAWHTQAIATTGAQALPLVLVREDAARGGTAVFLHAEAQDHLFALATALLDQLDLTILDARLTSARSGRTLDTYLVLEADGVAISDVRAAEIRATLDAALRTGESRIAVSRRPARVLRHFPTPTEVHFSDDERNRRTVLELISTDRPGLLSCVGRAFQDCGVRVHNAKIATLGARAEDFFFITTADNRPYDDPTARESLRARLIGLLDTV